MSDDIKKLLDARNAGGAGLPSAPRQDGHIPLKLGHVPVPKILETQHFLISGSTGAGKSQQLYQMFNAIRARNEPAIVVDNSAEFTKRYYRPGIDIIFNPFDVRSVGWSVMNEARNIWDFDFMSQLIVPDMDGPNADWQMQAQQLQSNILSSLFKMYETTGNEAFLSNEALIYFATSASTHSAISTDATADKMRTLLSALADTEENDVDLMKEIRSQIRGVLSTSAGDQNQASLQYLLKDTPSKRLFEPGVEKTLGITLQILTRYMQPFTYLKEGDFSVRDFVDGFTETEGVKPWLFITYSASSYAAVRTIIALLVTFAVQAGIDLEEDMTFERRFFFMLDELSSLEKIPALEAGLTKLRKYGGVVIASLQTIAQLELETKYGKIGAQILLANFGNLLMLKTADNDTAERLSLLVGDIELEQTSETKGVSANSGKGGASDGWSSSTTTQLVIKRRILPSRFYNLRRMHGYVRIAGDETADINEVTATRIPDARMPIIEPGIMLRPDVRLKRPSRKKKVG